MIFCYGLDNFTNDLGCVYAAATVKRLTMFQSFSTGKPITGLTFEAKFRSSATSSTLSLHPSAPINSSACSAVLAPGIGTTFP